MQRRARARNNKKFPSLTPLFLLSFGVDLACAPEMTAVRAPWAALQTE